ncbi:transposase, partial [Xanthomonas arboricola]|uniref:transposase n=1 Tax=Xanthomonas arboricola TaxID=56448 RepID=UPI00069CD729
MSSKRYTDEFKIAAVRHVTDGWVEVADVAERLGVHTHRLYACVRTFGKPGVGRRAEGDQ